MFEVFYHWMQRYIVISHMIGCVMLVVVLVGGVIVWGIIKMVDKEG